MCRRICGRLRLTARDIGREALPGPSARAQIQSRKRACQLLKHLAHGSIGAGSRAVVRGPLLEQIDTTDGHGS